MNSSTSSRLGRDVLRAPGAPDRQLRARAEVPRGCAGVLRGRAPPGAVRGGPLPRPAGFAGGAAASRERDPFAVARILAGSSSRNAGLDDVSSECFGSSG